MNPGEERATMSLGGSLLLGRSEDLQIFSPFRRATREKRSNSPPFYRGRLAFSLQACETKKEGEVLRGGPRLQSRKKKKEPQSEVEERVFERTVEEKS